MVSHTIFLLGPLCFSRLTATGLSPTVCLQIKSNKPTTATRTSLISSFVFVEWVAWRKCWFYIATCNLTLYEELILKYCVDVGTLTLQSVQHGCSLENSDILNIKYIFIFIYAGTGPKGHWSRLKSDLPPDIPLSWPSSVLSPSEDGGCSPMFER